MTDAACVSWVETVALVKADVLRRLVLEGRPVRRRSAVRLMLKPGVVCVVAYRVATFLHHRGHRLLSQLVQDMQHLYTGIEIHPGSEIGPGFVVGDRPGGGISEHVTIGRNCTVLGGATMTLNSDGIDLSKGRIVIGDHCVVGVNVRIIGAVRLGHGTQIKPNSVVLSSSLADGGVLVGIPASRRGTVPAELMAGWNPLRSRTLLPEAA